MDFIKGFDISTLAEVERCGGKFYAGGQAEDALTILLEPSRIGKSAAMANDVKFGHILFLSTLVFGNYTRTKFIIDVFSQSDYNFVNNN